MFAQYKKSSKNYKPPLQQPTPSVLMTSKTHITGKMFLLSSSDMLTQYYLNLSWRFSHENERTALYRKPCTSP